MNRSDTSRVSAFSLLHPALQEHLYQMRWTQLRPIQVDAIYTILGSSKHALIAANTAGGKTEAAFLPIISHILQKPSPGLRAIYVGPLKALINDQFRRLDELCAKCEMSVHRWHGDVSRQQKQSFLQTPSPILLITPESIESLFINHPHHMASLFGSIEFIVIDELHVFIGKERGAHLRSLIARIRQRSMIVPRLVGLSATMGDPALAAKWLLPDEESNVRIISDAAAREIKYRMKGYLRNPSREQENVDAALPNALQETPSDEALADDLIREFRGKKSLIFANSRATLEFYTDMLSRRCKKNNLADHFRIHHGSLSKAEREDTEDALRSEIPTATLCSATLELGIDVGSIRATGHIGCPWSVNSLAQRLGRSGRRDGEASVMYMHIVDDEPGPKTSLVDCLFPELLQAIAMTDLLLAKWSEPPDWNRLHVSTLVQQLLSVIAETGGATASLLFSQLVRNGAFQSISDTVFLQILRDLAQHDLIEQTSEGDLILGLEGERVVRSADFYSSFVTTQEYRVSFAGKVIGMVAAAPGTGADGFLILAGRRWRILDIDEQRKDILVEPAKGGRLPYFRSEGGADIHPHVRATMRQVLFGNSTYVYLDEMASHMLSMARDLAVRANLARNPLVQDGRDVWWFTWTGSRIQRTLAALGQHFAGIDLVDEEIALRFSHVSVHEVLTKYSRLSDNCPPPEEIASKVSLKIVEKYDHYLSPGIQSLAYTRNLLDQQGAIAFMRETLPTLH